MEKTLLDIAVYSLIFSFFGYFFVLAVGETGTRKPYSTIPFVLLTIGFIGLLSSFIVRSLEAQFLAISNLYESIILYISLMLGAYIIIEFKFKFNKLGGFIVFFALLWLFWAATLDSSIPQLPAALRSYWRSIHVPPLLTSYGLFTIACIASVGYLILDRLDRQKQSPKEPQEVLDTPFKRRYLPSELCAEVAFRSIAFGIPLITFGIITGAMWANESWGTYWSWDPKESMALVTLLGYTIYLHLKIQGLAKNITLAWISIGCFGLTLLTYIGVNMLDFGLHSYGRLG